MGPKSAIVTGATSFIGISLIKELIANDYSIIAVIRSNSSRKGILTGLFPEIRLIECNLGNMYNNIDMFREAESCNEFFYIAWNSDFFNPRYNLEGQMKNVEYMIDALKTAKALGCRRFLALGSQAECGLRTKPINSSTDDSPITAYAVAKCEAYKRGCELSSKLEIEFFWPRLLSAFGPYDREETLVMSCIDACINRKRLFLTAAEQIWDYVYVDDVARALRLIVERGTPKKKYTIASGHGRQLRDYIADITYVFGYPELMDGIGRRNYANNEVMYLVGDVSEIYNDTGMVFRDDFVMLLKKMKHWIFGGKKSEEN